MRHKSYTEVGVENVTLKIALWDLMGQMEQSHHYELDDTGNCGSNICGRRWPCPWEVARRLVGERWNEDD